ncbi:MAG TPA: hypothetical protein VHU13_07620 [Solirubrobacteraceae bacterium]|nr:hypothetical protein [Solirubrobacteraceae bacterium]
MRRGSSRSGFARLPLGLLVCALSLCRTAALAHASLEPIRLQSVGPHDQFERADEPAISSDGGYLAFVGSLDGTGGVWRKDLRTGALQLVAQSGIAPSISADGRYVSFTSGEPLVTHAKTGENVYVRDMQIDPGLVGQCAAEQEADDQCPYELASALNGGSEGITYEGGGANASGRVSLGADGREVAFVLTSSSDLTSGDPQQLTTPARQVVLRRLDSQETLLVSAEREAGGGRMTERPVPGGAYLPSQAGASISGDGSTVAWVGTNIPAQAPTLEGEGQRIEEDDQDSQETVYDEPLWRRVGGGAGAPTRRMVGGGDPLAPGCPPGGTIQVAACRGPYPGLPWEDTRGGNGNDYGWLGYSGYDGLPALSYDGYTAALVGDPDGTSNVFVVDMREGLDRVQALRQLTREIPVFDKNNPGSQPEYVSSAGDVYAVAISSDASRVAFTTQRQLFSVSPLIDNEAPLTQLGIVELYQIVSGGLLERVTHGPDDGPCLEGRAAVGVTASGATAPSFGDGDLTVAFADTASNIVYADSNEESDIFTASESRSSQLPGPVQIGATPPGSEPTRPQWRLSVVPTVHRDGSVTLFVAVPGAGEVSSDASAAVPVRTIERLSPGRRGRAGSEVKHTVDRNRTVASTRASSATAGLLELRLRVSSRYAALLSSPAGIYATVRVSFRGAGPTLTQALTLSLHRAPPPRARRGRSRSHGARNRSRPVHRGGAANQKRLGLR